jgi:hypothetical protein
MLARLLRLTKLTEIQILDNRMMPNNAKYHLNNGYFKVNQTNQTTIEQDTVFTMI